MARRLTEIANDYGTDKGTTHGDRHGYTLIYELLLGPYRGSAEQLDRVAQSGATFDIIIDDGSHASCDQCSSPD
jgi:hypothetical protein